MIDCQLIELIRDDILIHSNQLPQQFIQSILAILNRGSIYSNSFENFLDLDSTRKLREEFSKICFETLLRFSFVNTDDKESQNDGSLNKMALTSMLNRCKEIIQRYAHDEHLSGNIPLPRLLVITLKFDNSFNINSKHYFLKFNKGHVQMKWSAYWKHCVLW